MHSIMLRQASLAQKQASQFLNWQLRNFRQVRLYVTRSQTKNNQKSTKSSTSSAASRLRPSNETIFLLCGSVLAGVFLYKRYYVNVPKILDEQLFAGKTVGKAALSSEWKLIDRDGKERKSSDFHGQFVLLYFGFTHCPDVCPVEIEKMCAIVDRVDGLRESSTSGLTDKLYGITPLMISVDPERDTPTVLKRYCADFSPKLIGLTGTSEEIEEVARSFHIYHARTRSTAESDGEQDYLVDHTIVTYLIGPTGEFVDYYGQYKPPEDVSGSIVMHMLSERNKVEEKK